uniref:RNase H type-1 domain-containing protein n=1 Tax=Cannabis sativa TaxID=3483 RepID=A0A803P4J2_CANSA
MERMFGHSKTMAPTFEVFSANHEEDNDNCWVSEFILPSVHNVKSGYSLAWSLQVDEGVVYLSQLIHWLNGVWNLAMTPKVKAGSLKLNVDAAIDGETSTISLGALVRDSDGFPLGCFAKPLTGFFSPKEAEALAIPYVLKWCLELGFFVSFVESDAEIIVNLVNSSLECASQWGCIVRSIRSLLSVFSGACLLHVMRNGNTAAHGLARYALQMENEVS